MNITELIENADDAYYATEYDKAIELYTQVLQEDTDNKHAQRQLRKAEFNRPLGTADSDLATEALRIKVLQLYRRSRSYIAAGDLDEARKLLKQAVEIAEKAGVDFPQAQVLLGNIEIALTAEEFKKKAFEALDTQQWTKVEENLNHAINLDPTDDTVQIQTLLLHLQKLLRARRLISRLEAGIEKIRKRTEMNKEIREIIELTNETTALSILWQDVVRLFGEYNNKDIVFRNRNIVFRGVVLIALCTGAILLLALWLFYLFPRNNILVDCDSVSPSLQAVVNYPAYIANGDKDRIEITFTNVGDIVIDGLVVFAFEGTANVQLVAPTDKSRIEFKDFRPHEKKPVTINFSVSEPFSVISNPRKYVDFNVCTSADDYNTFHIAMSPIYGLRNLIKFLWGIIVATLVPLFWSEIKDWLLSIFGRKSG